MATWDANFEASPADGDERQYGANKIRELKVSVSDRLELEHNFKANSQPSHKAGIASIAYSGSTANIANLASPGVGGLAWDTTLKAFKIRSANTWDRVDTIPSGTKMLFYQDTAPAGWTIDNTLDDKVVYVTKGSAANGQTGGAAHANGTWTISGLTVDANLQHTHETEVTADQNWGTGITTNNVGRLAVYYAGYVWAYANSRSLTSNAGGVNLANQAVASNAGWRPAAYNFIVCAKD